MYTIIRDRILQYGATKGELRVGGTFPVSYSGACREKFVGDTSPLYQ